MSEQEQQASAAEEEQARLEHELKLRQRFERWSVVAHVTQTFGGNSVSPVLLAVVGVIVIPIAAFWSNPKLAIIYTLLGVGLPLVLWLRNRHQRKKFQQLADDPLGNDNYDK